MLLAGVLASGVCACSAAGIDTGSGKLKVVTTIFPEYDWVMNVLGENPAKADVTLLLDNGADLPRFCGCPEIFIREFIMHIRAFSRYIFSVMTEE